MTLVEICEGDSPVILGLPHTGTFLPAEIVARLNARGQLLADTDWHIHRLYDGLLPGATTVRATFHRYVIDANRGADDASLYPGQNTTGLVPLTDFDGRPIWTEPPTEDDIADRSVQEARRLVGAIHELHAHAFYALRYRRGVPYEYVDAAWEAIIIRRAKA